MRIGVGIFRDSERYILLLLLLLLLFYIDKVETANTSKAKWHELGQGRSTTAQLGYCDGPKKENERHSRV